MYKGHSIKLTDDFSSSAMKSKRQCDDIFKVRKSIIPYSAKLFFKNEDVKIYHGQIKTELIDNRYVPQDLTQGVRTLARNSEKAMATHSSTLAWKIPWMEEPGRSWAQLSDFTFTFMHWRKKWQPTPVFLPWESQGQQSLVGCCLWGRTESDTTEVT